MASPKITFYIFSDLPALQLRVLFFFTTCVSAGRAKRDLRRSLGVATTKLSQVDSTCGAVKTHVARQLGAKSRGSLGLKPFKGSSTALERARCLVCARITCEAFQSFRAPGPLSNLRLSGCEVVKSGLAKWSNATPYQPLHNAWNEKHHYTMHGTGRTTATSSVYAPRRGPHRRCSWGRRHHEGWRTSKLR